MAGTEFGELAEDALQDRYERLVDLVVAEGAFDAVCASYSHR